MITRTQFIPLLLEACPSFHSIWGELQRPDEDKVIYVAFGAFAGHMQRLQRLCRTSEFSAVERMLDRFRSEGDSEVQKLADELTESIHSVLSS